MPKTKYNFFAPYIVFMIPEFPIHIKGEKPVMVYEFLDSEKLRLEHWECGLRFAFPQLAN
jgi:hypothetical protein